MIIDSLEVATVTAEAAEVFATGGIKLLGNEGQTVGPEDTPMQVHLILLHTAPLNLGGADGAPCRAYLIDLEDII